MPIYYLFEPLVPFGKIMVTGPQRSGTTICAKMIAHDLGVRYIDEDDIGWKSASVMDEDALRRLFQNETGFVVQAPAAAHMCHQLGADDVAVVFMMRDVDAIIASQKRIGWKYERVELDKYDAPHGPIAVVKYRCWFMWQRDMIKHPFEIEYAALHQHPMWVPQDKRRGFATRQTEE